jgi:hypothetical protein
MDQRAGAALRWLRAAVLAAVVIAAGAIGHVAADGLLPGWPVFAVVCLGTLLVAAAQLGRPASTARVVTLLVLGQTAVHLVLTAAAGHRGTAVGRADGSAALAAPPPPPPPRPDFAELAQAGPRTGSLHDQLYPGHQPVITDLSVPVPLQHLAADFTAANAPMAVAHLLAAVAVGWWLAQGERAVWVLLALTSTRARDLARGLALLLVAVLHAVALDAKPARRAPTPDAVADLRPPRLAALAETLSRRGPPALEQA